MAEELLKTFRAQTKLEEKPDSVTPLAGELADINTTSLVSEEAEQFVERQLSPKSRSDFLSGVGIDFALNANGEKTPSEHHSKISEIKNSLKIINKKLSLEDILIVVEKGSQNVDKAKIIEIGKEYLNILGFNFKLVSGHLEFSQKQAERIGKSLITLGRNSNQGNFNLVVSAEMEVGNKNKKEVETKLKSDGFVKEITESAIVACAIFLDDFAKETKGGSGLVVGNSEDGKKLDVLGKKEKSFGFDLNFLAQINKDGTTSLGELLNFLNL